MPDMPSGRINPTVLSVANRYIFVIGGDAGAQEEDQHCILMRDWFDQRLCKEWTVINLDVKKSIQR